MQPLSILDGDQPLTLYLFRIEKPLLDIRISLL